MDKYTATEQAYKNGYEKGYKAAKAEEKHGHWIIKQIKNSKYRYCFCSECLTTGTVTWKRCPVCEAKMDVPKISDLTKDALNNIGKKAHGGKE